MLVACEPTLEELGDVAFHELRSRPRDHDRAGGLAPLPILYAHDGAFRYAGPVGEHILELRRMNVLAPRDNHVLRAADDPVIAVLVDAGEIAAAEPAVGRKPGVVFPVPAHDGRPFDPEFAVHEFDLAVWSRLAGASGFAHRVLAPQRGGDRPRPRRAVDLSHRH